MLKTSFDSQGFTLILADKKGKEALVYTLDDAKGEPVRLFAALKAYVVGKK